MEDRGREGMVAGEGMGGAEGRGREGGGRLHIRAK